MSKVVLSFEDGRIFPTEQGTYLVKLANGIGRLSYALILFRTASEWAEDMQDCCDEGEAIIGWCKLPEISTDPDKKGEFMGHLIDDSLLVKCPYCGAIVEAEV